MRRLVALAVGVLMMVAPAGCARTEQQAEPGGGSVAFALYTHCGIHSVRFQDGYYEAVEPLDDGQGNPPKGWGNPEQRGTMRFVSATEIEFRSDAGTVRFRAAPEPAEPRLCA